MSLADRLGMFPTNALKRPVSVRYNMQASFGWTQQVLSFDLFGLQNDPAKIPGALWALWSGIVAPATSHQTSLWYLEYVDWRSAPAPLIYAGLPASGLIVERSGPRDQQAVVVMHTGHADELAARRLFTPGMPRAWTDGSLLTERGWDSGMQWVNALAMGALAWYVGGEVSLIIAYPGILPSVPENLLGVAFRLVSDLRLCQYVDKAPELSLGLWP